jgi:hypothetical protein
MGQAYPIVRRTSTDADAGREEITVVVDLQPRPMILPPSVVG